MNNRKALDTQAHGMMAILCLIWGLQQVLLKAAAPDVAPLMQIAIRSGVAAALVGLLMWWRKERIFDADSWRPGLVVGGLFGLEFFFIGEGLRFTSASHMVVLLYTAPIFVALGLHWKLPSERLSALQWVGTAAAFAGIAITFLGRSQANVTDDQVRMLWGDLLALMAGVGWAATTVAVRITNLSRAPATLTLLYQLVGGFVLLMPVVIASGQASINPTPLAIGSLLFQSLAVSFASYLAWFWLLKRYLASGLGALSFLTPLFGTLFGVWLLDEPLEPSFVAGTALVLSGVTLVSGYEWIRQALAAR